MIGKVETDWVENPLGRNYKKDSIIEELVTGKTIAYVGPAPQIAESGYGKHIDSHDLVFRTGDFLKGENIDENYGSRTDVLVHSFNEHDRPCLFRESLADMRKCKCLVCSMISLEHRDIQNVFFDDVGVPYYNMEDEVFEGETGIRKYLDCLPNTGFIGLLMLLEYDIKNVFITGMTFYDMGKWVKSYHDNWYTEGASALKYQHFGLNERHDLHKQLPQIKHFQKIYEKYSDKIELDEYLTENLWTV
jgi:hypothetical protein